MGTHPPVITKAEKDGPSLKNRLPTHRECDFLFGASRMCLAHAPARFSALVYRGYDRHWRRRGVFTRWNRVLREKLRFQTGRNKQPSAMIVDSQSVKTSEKGGPEATMPARK